MALIYNYVTLAGRCSAVGCPNRGPFEIFSDIQLSPYLDISQILPRQCSGLRLKWNYRGVWCE